MKGDIGYDPLEDWAGDSKGKEQMDFIDFYDAMFELADVWCPKVLAKGRGPRGEGEEADVWFP